ncbi:hypothetical protein KP509_27G018000 [Ceratopteris richardii]|uniref:Uncharacterized protein n=1 Tax=Ceratopteris richardii TaxID=49495 RepID=A0A8T2RFN7_CERRI|nr:hypothetical protein KP509_27G018000 [Ceratopteris richardii]
MNINFEFCTKREDGSTKRRRRMLCDFVLQQWRDYDQEGSEAEKKKAHVKGGKDCHVLMGLEFCMKKRPHRQIRGINRERRTLAIGKRIGEVAHVIRRKGRNGGQEDSC